MHRIFTINSVVLLLFVSLLTNGLAWAFHGEVFMHELGHDHQYTPSLADRAQTEYHHGEFNEDDHLNHSPHICFNVVYQPLIFTMPPLVPVEAGNRILIKSVSYQVPKSIPDSLFRPPRSILFI